MALMPRGAVSALLLAAVFMVQDTPLTPFERRWVDAWLTCIDCHAELDSVRAVGQRKPAATVDTLALALAGPPVSRRLRSESLLVAGYVRDSAYLARHQQPPQPTSRDTAAARRLRGFVEGYQIRAALALGWIHTPRAVAVLDSALLTPMPDRVRSVLQYARDSLP